MVVIAENIVEKKTVSNPAIFLRLPPHVGVALDRLVDHYTRQRGRATKNDVVRELILEADRKLKGARRRPTTPRDES